MERVKLSEILKVKTGKFDANHAKIDGKYKFFTCAMASGLCNTYAFDEEVLLLPGNGANVGEVFHYKGKFDAYQRTYVLYEIKAEVKYLFYIFKTSWKAETLKKQVGSATNYIKLDDILSFEIPLPPLPTQKAIAAKLDKAQEIISYNKQLIEKYDQLTQSLFIDMFGDPVRNEKGWEVKKLGEICFYIKDGPHVSPKYSDSTGIPFISVNNIIKGSIDLSNSRYISKEDFKIYSKKGKAEFGDILYTKGGTTGFAKKVDVDFDFMHWVHLALLKFDKSVVIPTFLEKMLNTNYCYTQSQKLTKGIANRDLVLGEMKKIKLFLPPTFLQNQFAERIEKIDAQKQMAQESLAKSEALFQSLLQESFK